MTDQPATSAALPRRCPEADDGWRCDLETGHEGDHLADLPNFRTHTWSDHAASDETAATATTDDELRWHLTAYHHRSIGWLARAARDDMDRVHDAAHTDPGHQHGRADHDH